MPLGVAVRGPSGDGLSAGMHGAGIASKGRVLSQANSGNPDHATSEIPGRYYFGEGFERWPGCRHLIPADEHPGLQDGDEGRYSEQRWLCPRAEPIAGCYRCGGKQPSAMSDEERARLRKREERVVRQAARDVLLSKRGESSADQAVPSGERNPRTHCPSARSSTPEESWTEDPRTAH